MVQTIVLMLLCYLQNNMLTQAKAETELRNDTEGNKILIATYTDERNLEKADSLLQTLPLQTPEDVDFYNFFNAYIGELQANPNLTPYDGKTPSAAALQIQNMAANTELHGNTAVFAQTTQAALYSNQYHRSPEDQKVIPNFGVNANPALRILPNPAQNETLITLEPAGKQELNHLNVYSITGKLLQTLLLNKQPAYMPILLNTQNLANGLYVCEIITQSGKIVTGKLLISR